ncbi:heterokaryon incompatibility protein-domain-containing protein [Dactylonectria estremocensis]|uniref:Heterokaryon incompatibility protein-domain-containing protein n=1 Tax=Dactylonectria estremocensis TaxID=1079267 RepID=A0A9P9EBD4_9HYPO|nr:heterokaryon incompatibility protein-domain-containing protein [Dactylonectria estremocensis]
MRLINARTLKLEVFNDPALTPYAILSHTWDGDEVSFEDMKDLKTARTKTPSFSKIEAACRLVLGEGLDYVWVDTCCIDKSSSAELLEAINSMFRWYNNAIYCLAYLSDLLPGDELIGALDAARNYRWFSRGWTLQELIAPAAVRFYNADWNFLGTKFENAKEIEAMTGIDQGVLKNLTPLAAISLAKRMSWAATRHTTRIEDMAYCLLGLFDVTMPMLYGEGPRAFTRLLEEILRKTTDLSLFAWRAPEDSEYCSVLAKSPAEFLGSFALLDSV